MDLSWLKNIAPTVASALGGPLAGVAVTVLGKALGLDEATRGDINTVLGQDRMTSEQVASIKVAELELKKHESDNGFRFAELEIRDRESARAMQIANKSMTPELISWAVILSTVALEGYIIVNGMPPSASDVLVGRILGTLDAAFVTVLTFWLGSSRSSHNKDAMLLSSRP